MGQVPEKKEKTTQYTTIRWWAQNHIKKIGRPLLTMDGRDPAPPGAVERFGCRRGRYSPVRAISASPPRFRAFRSPVRFPVTCPEHRDKSSYVETGADYGNHRAGRILSCGAVAVERIRGPGHRSPSGPGSPGEPSQTAGNGPLEAWSECCVFRELREPPSSSAEIEAGRVLPLGGAELCQIGRASC